MAVACDPNMGIHMVSDYLLGFHFGYHWQLLLYSLHFNVLAVYALGVDIFYSNRHLVVQ